MNARCILLTWCNVEALPVGIFFLWQYTKFFLMRLQLLWVAADSKNVQTLYTHGSFEHNGMFTSYLFDTLLPTSIPATSQLHPISIPLKLLCIMKVGCNFNWMYSFGVQRIRLTFLIRYSIRLNDSWLFYPLADCPPLGWSSTYEPPYELSTEMFIHQIGLTTIFRMV